MSLPVLINESSIFYQCEYMHTSATKLNCLEHKNTSTAGEVDWGCTTPIFRLLGALGCINSKFIASYALKTYKMGFSKKSLSCYACTYYTV